MSTVVDRLYSLVKRGKEGKNIGLHTGLDKLDKVLYGIQRRHLTVIGGPTAGGKSALCYYSYIFRPLMDIYQGKVKDCWILVFSFEISAEILYAKLLSMYIQEEFGKVISYKEILSLVKPITDEGEQYILAAREWLQMVEDHIAIVDTPMDAGGIEVALRKFTEQYGQYIIRDGEEVYIPNNPEQYIISILDHLALIDQRPLKVGIDEASKVFIRYRNKASITAILLQQLNRNGQAMDRRTSNAFNRPDLGDFQDSSGACQAAEAVIAIYDAYREKQKTDLGYDLEMLKDRYRTLCILKNRIGESNKVTGVHFTGETGRWKDLPPAKEITDYTPYKFPDGERLEYDKDANEDVDN